MENTVLAASPSCPPSSSSSSPPLRATGCPGEGKLKSGVGARLGDKEGEAEGILVGDGVSPTSVGGCDILGDPVG